MLSLQAAVCSSAKPLFINLANASLRKFLHTTLYARSIAAPAANYESSESHDTCCDRTNNYSGVKIEEIVELDSSKPRLDSWISSRISGISRARVQSSIRSGLVSVNGRVISKASHVVRNGDLVNCMIAELQPLRAEPEDIPLDIVYEDEHVLVVNKPAHMVVHPAPGNATGTLVNGILHHCRFSDMYFSPETLPDIDDDSEDEIGAFTVHQSHNVATASVRPGIVHRLDKGTSGLLVVAKDEHSHAHLAEQFKNHTIKRVYVSLTCGVPSPVSGRVNVPVGRDANNRIRMIAIPGSAGYGKARHAISRYRVVEILAGGGIGLVEWKLETGRTHQHIATLCTTDYGPPLSWIANCKQWQYISWTEIRAHAKYLGVPLLGDDVYGGTKNMAMSLLQSKNPLIPHTQILELVDRLDRPSLHALSLGFKHPVTGENMHFSEMPPMDFAETLDQLRSIGVTLLS